MKYLFKEYEDSLVDCPFTFTQDDLINTHEALQRIAQIRYGSGSLKSLVFHSPKIRDNYDKLKSVIDDALYRINKIKADMEDYDDCRTTTPTHRAL